VAAWIATRTPPAPEALARLLEARLGSRPAGDAPAVAAACVDSAAALLTELLSSGCTTREAALDLLAADALATYAFEAAGDAPERLDALAADAMARLSAIGDRPPRDGAAS
jgi:hypothetical protein